MLDLLILDLWAYTWHRINHVVQPLWRFHQVHHRDEMLDVTSAGRNHPGELVIAAFARVPVLLVMGIPLLSVAVFETIHLVAAAFHHCNMRMPPRLERVLSWFIVTPRIHWMHHRALRVDTDSNYSVIFSWWDRIFRSVAPHQRTPGMKLGVEGVSDHGLLRLLALPFTRRQT